MKIPDKAGWGEAVTNVDCFRAGYYPMAKAAFVGYYQVISGKVETFKGQGIKNKEKLVVGFDKRKLIHERSSDVPPPVEIGHSFGVIDGSVDGSIGKQFFQGFQYKLSSTVLV